MEWEQSLEWFTIIYFPNSVFEKLNWWQTPVLIPLITLWEGQCRIPVQHVVDVSGWVVLPCLLWMKLLPTQNTSNHRLIPKREGWRQPVLACTQCNMTHSPAWRGETSLLNLGRLQALQERNILGKTIRSLLQYRVKHLCEPDKVPFVLVKPRAQRQISQHCCSDTIVEERSRCHRRMWNQSATDTVKYSRPVYRLQRQTPRSIWVKWGSLWHTHIQIQLDEVQMWASRHPSAKWKHKLTHDGAPGLCVHEMCEWLSRELESAVYIHTSVSWVQF